MIQPNVDISTITSQATANRMENLAHTLAHTGNKEKEIDKVASEFQTMCYAHLVKLMFSTTEDSAVWGEGHASGLLRSMFIDALANAGGAELLNLKTSIKNSIYQSMGISNEPDTLNKNSSIEKHEAVNVLL